MALKAAVGDVQSPHSATNCLQHVRSSGQGAMESKSHATHRAFITCNTWYEGTAQLFNLTELESLPFYIYIFAETFHR